MTLGEGDTPLIKLEKLTKELGCELWAKCEFVNPTGSFKDRGSVTEVNQALAQGKRGVVCASTGNMAASLAAYAAKAGLECIAVVPDITPESKMRQALACGARLERVSGNYDQCVARAKQIADEENYFLCGDYELRRLGQTTIGVELAQSGIEIDAFIVPVGNGTVGCAISQGFAVFGKFPKFLGVQGTGANPIYLAWKNKSKIKKIENPTTIASAMNVGRPLDGKLVLDWVMRTSGEMFSVTDEQIRAAQKKLAEKEGIYVESAAASALAAFTNWEKFKNKKIVLILTGSGLKER